VRPLRKFFQRSPSIGALREAFAAAFEFPRTTRKLQAEIHRLGMHAVRGPINGVARCSIARSRRASAAADRFAQDHVARLAHLERLRRVDDVRRGHAECSQRADGPTFSATAVGKRITSCWCDLLDLFDARERQGTALANVARGVGRMMPAAAIASARRSRRAASPTVLVRSDPPHIGGVNNEII